MQKCTISKDGRILFVCVASCHIDAIKKYCRELGDEAHAYCTADPDWLYDLEFEFEDVEPRTAAGSLD